ncbi:MAG: hypothetical protein ABSH41_20165 [Syntrophobacteraceae bacterium]
MELNEKKSCHFDKIYYPDGAEECTEGFCLVCKDGQWVDTPVQKGSY